MTHTFNGRGCCRKFSSILRKILSVVALGAACGSAVAVEQWIPEGGTGVYVRNVVRFANTPVTGQSVVFASTLGAGVLKITHAGAGGITTAQINSGLPLLRVRNVSAIDVNTLFAAVENYGIYKSTDGGTSWTAANGSGVTALACLTPRNLNARSSTELWVPTACRRNSGIYRSLDGGATWARMGAGTIPDDAAVGSLAFSGTGVTTVIIAATARDGMFRSADNGLTWTQINNGIPAPAGANRISVQNAAYLANANDALAYVEGQGVFRSTDSGANWAAYGSGLPSTAHALGGISRESATIMYIGSDKGPVYRTTDGGLNWSAWVNTGTFGDISFVRGVTIDPTAAGRYWLHGINGISITNNNAVNFSQVSTPDGFATAASVDGTGNALYAANQYLYKIPNLYNPDWDTQSLDISGTLPSAIGSVTPDTNVAGTLYVTLPNRGVFKTVNDGGAWAPLTLPNLEVGVNPALELAISDTQIVYAGMDNKFGTATGGGFLKSVNGGTTWADSSSGLVTPDSRQVNSIAVQTDPNILLIATDDGIYKSINGGASWTLSFAVNDALAMPLPFSGIRFDPTNGAIAWAAATHVDPDGTVRASSGVYKTINTGTNWTQVLASKRAIQVRPEMNGRVAALMTRDLTQAPVLATKDGGVTWPSLSNGILENDGVSLARTSTALGSHLVIALTTQGIYVLDKPQLSVTVTGSGSVASSPVAISCPGTCSAKIYDNELVTLTATPSAGKAFSGWSGACTGTGVCQFRMDGAKSVTAAFTDPNPPRLANISTRMQVLTGNDVMIAGFIVGGPTAKTVVINVAGPNLVNFGIANALMNPTLTLVRSSDQAVLKTNDNWQTQTIPADVAAIQAAGFQPNNPAEPAIIATLAPGAYTAIVQGAGGTTGVGLVGVFEVDHPEVPLINISTRGQVLTGNDVMIAGFIIQGSSAQTVVVNVAGPHLANFGIANPLANPTLTLVRSSDQAVLKTNDNWQTQTIPGDVAAIQATGFQPNNALEPAIIATLAPGAYTAIVQGSGGGTGVALVGVFTVQ